MIKFVIISKDENFMMGKNDIIPSLDIDLQLISNNKQPITILYNQYLKSVRETKCTDFLVFMHADVKFDVAHLINRIYECKDKYDLMFLCGTSKISIGHSPLNWFAASNEYRDNRWGCVTHGEIGGSISFFSSHSPNIEDHSIAVGDGLCIIFGPNAINSNLLFDERLRFNCYDTQISLSAILNFNLKVGCIVEKSLQHYSIGKQILSDDFLKDEKILREIFNFEIPVNSRLNQLIDQQII